MFAIGIVRHQNNVGRSKNERLDLVAAPGVFVLKLGGSFKLRLYWSRSRC